jgi:hypothetical protein
MLYIQLLLVVGLVLLAVRVGAYVVRRALYPPRELDEMKLRIVELEQAIAELRESQRLRP